MGQNDNSREQEPATPAPLRCVQGCYTVKYDNALESGGPGWFPLRVLDGDWRAYFSVGFFQLVVLRFPTYQEAVDYLYGQP